jgi:hypothetical protein
MFISNYLVNYYVNGKRTYTKNTVSKKDAYNTAVPPEALSLNPLNRWHLLSYLELSEKIDSLLVGETVLVCWQDYHPELDTEHVVIMRDEDLWKNNINLL